MEFTGERYIPELNGKIELEHLNRYYFVVSQIDLKNKLVLDIASGEGYGSDILSQYAQQVVGVDISGEAIDHAKKKYKKDNLSFIQGDTSAIPLPDKMFDIVVSFETIEHHDKHQEMMEEVKRVLKPDGILFISSPDRHFYSEIPKLKNEFHIRELCREEFIKLLQSYYSHTKFYAQQVITCSIIGLENSEIFKNTILIDKTRSTTLIKPVYNIAIAANRELNDSNYDLLICQDNNYYYSMVELNDTIAEIRHTRAFRIGKFILTPFKVLSKLLR